MESSRQSPKPIAFQGDSLDDLRAFPAEARREAGHRLDRVQRGLDLDPDDWKMMPSIGPGVREVHDEAGAFRVVYTTTRPEAVYVLHAFRKKTPQTAKRDLHLAKVRLWELIRRGL